MGDWRDTKWAFFDDRLVPIDEARINVRATLAHYGAGIFEGIRAYWNEDRQRQYIFRGKEHYERMIKNAKIIAMDIKYGVEELMEKTMELLKREDFKEDTYIRPLAYYNSLNLVEKLRSNKYGFCIYCLPMAAISDIECGQNVCVSSWTRVHDNAITARGKIVGTYVNISLALYDAKESGYDDTILLNSNGWVSEGAGQNVAMIRNGTFVSPPITADILEGITLDSVQEIVHRELGMDFERRPIARTELYHADELFFCGTGAQVTPIVSVDHRKIGNGRPGKITRKLQDLFFDIVRGRNESYAEWLREVV